MPATYPVEDALHQLRPMLDAYRDGHMSMEDIANWLANFEAELSGADPAWQEASRRIRVLLSEVENGYGNKASIHRGLEAIARDCQRPA